MSQIATLITATRTLSFNFSPSKKLNPPPMDPLQRARLLSKIAAITCSSAWTDAVFDRAAKLWLDPANANLHRQLSERGIYPPPADLGRDDWPRRHPVRMRRCDGCRRLVPPNNLAEHAMVQLCDDCRIEPADADQHGEGGVARAPSARLGALVEGYVDDQTPRAAARSRLEEIGLSPLEINVLAFTIEGYATRRVAVLTQLSQAYVRKLLRSAERKLRKSGLGVPQRQKRLMENPHQRLRLRTIDPSKLNGLTESRR